VIEVPSSVRLDPPPHPSGPRRRRTDDPLNEADWAQFRERVTGMRESELAAFIRDYAAHRPTLPLPDPPPFRGVLDDELSAFIRDNEIEFPVLTPEDKAEAAWEAKRSRRSRAERSDAKGLAEDWESKSRGVRSISLSIRSV
jgi:hypothetical protein